ncbi:MAG: hypothetical protein JWR80_7903 [Bradyrhizobium sp.]|nr:hypothetical protein [Bradyrhizobium sp.]
MTETYVSESTSVFAPPCETCGAATRIYGIEPHARLARTEVYTYVCDACDETQAIVVPLSKAEL